jgi:small GTP-binding protein
MGSCTSSRAAKARRRSTIAIPFIERPKRRVLIVGLDGAGKTTLLTSLSKKASFRDSFISKPTSGFNVETCRVNGFDLTIWDVGGSEKQRTHQWRHYYTGVQGLVFVVDSVDEARFSIAAKELLTAVRDDQLFSACFLLLANKQDLPDAKRKSDIEKALGVGIEGDLKHALGDRPVAVFESSAITGTGIQEGLDWLCEKMIPL